MSDEYDKDRDKVEGNNARGRIFENGTYRYFRDGEAGYVQQQRQPRAFVVGNKRVHFDKIRDDRGKISGIEEKSGRMEGEKDEKQLDVAYDLLKQGVLDEFTLRSVQGEYRSKEVQERIDRLNRDFKDKFVHQLIPRDVAHEVWIQGLQREPGQQLEVGSVGQQAREQRQQMREVERAAEKARQLEIEKERERIERAERIQLVRDQHDRRRIETRERMEREQRAKELAQARQLAMEKARERTALFRDMERFREGVERGQVEARERAERNREVREQEQARQREETARMQDQLGKDIQAQVQQIAKDREVGRAIDADQLYEIHKELTQGLNVLREQERQETRNMLGMLDLSKDQAREMEIAFELSREDRREDVVKDLNTIALTVQREDQRRAAVAAQRREAVEKEQREREAREAREAYGQALRERGISPEVAALIQHQQAPGLESEREREGQEPPQVQGRSRDIGGRGRGIERTRD
ncbi:hypothetical protein D5S18_25975 [Nocardia panacis]|uniref:Uncharacterized protein n=1 Tax=Nocardia panacis TaxID=2340916 RepID=A0A3A4JVR2_9NOCA|nr:hypothetical protein [Nocardia panacis]RJO70662.1 hypothetical protein D5S18_25975 [Nocardia panacis]